MCRHSAGENAARTCALTYAVWLYERHAQAASRNWIWVVLSEMRVPEWVICALRALHTGFAARILLAGVVAGSVFDIARGIKQGCPSSFSVWALIFDPAVRLLRARMPGLRDELAVFADDIAATSAEVATHLLALLRVFDALCVAAGLALNYVKTLVVGYGYQCDFVLERRLLGATGAAQLGVAPSGVCLGIPVGPAAAEVFWDAVVARHPPSGPQSGSTLHQDGLARVCIADGPQASNS